MKLNTKTNGLSCLTAIAAGAAMMLSSASAEENLWIYAKGTDTRPQGSVELKLGVVSRFGKVDADYLFNDIRPEIEYGITNRLTVGAELLIFHHDYSVTNPKSIAFYLFKHRC